MKNIFSKKNILIITLSLAVCVITGVTYSFYTDSDFVENKMELGFSKGEIVEEFDGVEKMVWVKNTGTTPLLVRANARMVCTNGDIVLNPNKIATATYNTYDEKNPEDTTFWIDGGDGWYYYSKLLPAECMENLNEYYHNVLGSTTDVLVNIELNEDATDILEAEEKLMYDGAELNVPVNFEYYFPLKIIEDGEEIYTHEEAWNIVNASKEVQDLLRTLVDNK